MKYEPSAEDIQHLRCWIDKIPYLPHEKLEDHILATIYRASKGSLERTKNAIDKFFEGRLKYPEMLKDLNPLDPAIQEEYDAESFVLPLPYKTKDGTNILVGHFGHCKKDHYNPYNRIKAYCMSILYLIRENKIEEGKVAAILDLKNLTFAHMTGITPAFLYKLFSIMMNAFPFRIKAIHLVNMPSIAEWGVSFAKATLKKKIADRIHINHKPEELLDYYPKDILPSDFGGDLENIHILFRKHRQELEKFSDEFIDYEMTMRECERLRPKNTDDLIVGSFRNLQVD